jgi:hypothetical protein
MKNKISNGMKKYTQKLLKTLPYIAIALLVGVTAVYAGSLTPPGAPAKTMKSLSDLYELIDTGANRPSTDFTTPATVAPTMYSLGDTYDLLATKISNIDTSKILTGTTIFGKDGNAVAGVDTSDANATASDIISPKTAYVNGVKLIGTAVAGTPAPTFASSDVNSYDCSWFTTMTDSTQPGVTSAQICAFNTGCSWVSNACTGGVQTGKTYMSWYAGKAACANSTEGGQTAGTWHLPTYGQLVDHYVNNNTSGGNPPTGFASDSYWSGTTYPGDTSFAYDVGMGYGYASYGVKSNKGSYLAHCSR